MKIAIDIRLLHNPNSGMGKYLSDLLKRITAHQEYEYYLMDYKLPRRNLLEKIYDQIYEQFWIQLLTPLILKKEDAKLLYSPNPPTSLLTTVPVVLTIPDLIFYLDSDLNWFIKRYLYWVYRLSAIKAKKIITFSGNSKQHIVDVLKINSNKIEVISPGIKEEIFGHKLADSKLQQIKQKFGITRKYILNIPGTFIARKNVNDLLISFNNLPLKVKKDFHLVFIGNDKHPSFSEFQNQVQLHRLEKYVTTTGYISEEEIKTLYQGAFMLVITATYEGFALPPLEAMSEKLPIIAITYDNSSLTEVIGDAGLIVHDRSSLTNAMLELITKNELRKKLIKNGLRQVKKYRWDRSVGKIIRIIQDSI